MFLILSAQGRGTKHRTMLVFDGLADLIPWLIVVY